MSQEEPTNPNAAMPAAVAETSPAAHCGGAATPDAVRQRVAELVEAASDGAVPAGEALAPDASLTALGLGSLGFLRLLDAIESAYGVEVEAGHGGRLDTVDQLVDRVCGLDRRPAE